MCQHQLHDLSRHLMQSKSNLGTYGATGAPHMGHVLQVPPGPPKRTVTLAPVTTLDTTQARGISRGAMRPLPSYYSTSQQSASHGAGSSLSKTSGISSALSAAPPFGAPSRPLSATRFRQDAQSAVGTDQRTPASGYSSSHIGAASHLSGPVAPAGGRAAVL